MYLPCTASPSALPSFCCAYGVAEAKVVIAHLCVQLTIYNLGVWLYRTWLPFSARPFVGKYLKTVLCKKSNESAKETEVHDQYVAYEKAVVQWQDERDKATGDVKKQIDEKPPAPGDAHGLYKYEYLNYLLAMKIWQIRKNEATCEKENKLLENNKPELPLPPQPDDSEINDFVSKYLKVCTCAHCSVLLPGGGKGGSVCLAISGNPTHRQSAICPERTSENSAQLSPQLSARSSI